MQICDLGIILSAKKYSENSFIIKIVSKNYGIYSGFMRGSKPSKRNPSKNISYQNFNLVDFSWKSRIAENLGFFKIEPIKSFLAHIITSPIKLSCLNSLSLIIENNILERDPHPEIFFGLLDLLENLEQENTDFLQNYIKFEIKLLEILGYGIDLSSCAATGVVENLHFVSPKSGRAVCIKAGEKYRNKLLILPQFLISNSRRVTKDDLLNGLKLSEYFLDKHIPLKFPNNFNYKSQLISLVKSEDF
jgi:DNA repair protein RecO (recombination protein O)